jgi:hypothetical protein
MRALPALFVGLILANGLIYAYGQGLLGAPRGGGEAERLGAQLAPEKLKVVSVGAPPPVAAAALACRSITGLTREQAAQLAEQLSAADAQLKATVRPEEGKAQLELRASEARLARVQLAAEYAGAAVGPCVNGRKE